MSYGEFLKRTITVAGIVVLLLGMWNLRQILMLAFLSAIVAVSLSIPVARLQVMGVRRGVAIAFTLVAVVSAIILFLISILPTLVIQVGAVVADFPEAFDEARGQYNVWYLNQPPVLQDLIPLAGDEQIQEFLNGLRDFVSPLLASAGNLLANISANLLIVIVVSIFLLIAPKDYARGVILLVPPDYRERALEIIVELRRTLTTWLSALTFSISITTFLVWLVLGVILGVPNGLALGVIAGVMTLIPNIGAVVPVIPIAIFTLADEPSRLPIVIIAYILIQQVESNFLTPSIVKYELNIPAALVFLFQVTAATLLGFLGILLAVPLLATIITLVREIYVYDILQQRDVRVDVEYTQTEGLKLVTEHIEPEKRTIMTQTFQVVDPKPKSPPPEDVIVAETRKDESE